MNFNGSLAELQAIIESLGIRCHWEHKGAFEVAVIDDGVSNLKLNWWPQTGILQLVGDPEQRQLLLEELQQALEDASAQPGG
jgi:hypothetical protein